MAGRQFEKCLLTLVSDRFEYDFTLFFQQQSKTNRPMRTSQLYNQDKNNSFTLMCCQKFDTIKSVSNKRTPTVKPLLVNPLMKNPKHAAVLAECGIQYDSPMAPIDVATRRADRIAKEKMKNVVTSVSLKYHGIRATYESTLVLLYLFIRCILLQYCTFVMFKQYT